MPMEMKIKQGDTKMIEGTKYIYIVHVCEVDGYWATALYGKLEKNSRKNILTFGTLATKPYTKRTDIPQKDKPMWEWNSILDWNPTCKSITTDQFRMLVGELCPDLRLRIYSDQTTKNQVKELYHILYGEP